MHLSMRASASTSSLTLNKIFCMPLVNTFSAISVDNKLTRAKFVPCHTYVVRYISSYVFYALFSLQVTQLVYTNKFV